MISIVVPVYNVEKYLEQCIESILKQTVKDLEIILVDDGSKDRCPQICDEYAQKDERIRVIHKKNGGLMSAWKTGVLQSSGEYVGFVDSDDWIDPDMYQNLYAAMHDNDADIALCGWIREGDNYREKEKIFVKSGLYDRKRLEKEIFPRIISFGKMLDRYVSPNKVTKLFKKELLIKNFEYYDEQISIGEDMIASFACIFDAQKIYVMEDYYPYHYRLNQSSMIEKANFNFYRLSLKMNRKLRQICDDKNVKGCEVQLNNDLLSLAFWSMERNIAAQEKLRRKLVYIKEIMKDSSFQNALRHQTLERHSGKCRVYSLLCRCRWSTGLYLFIAWIVLKKRKMFGY